MQQTVEYPASMHTGENATPRRRAFAVPTDTPAHFVPRKLRAEVEDSLRDICGNWPTGEFDRIVADVTATAMKYHGSDRRHSNKYVPATWITKTIPGATSVVVFVLTAMQPVQRFLHMETLSFK
ncbi:MAG: hypothetical protein ABIZ36_03245 [Gemmatimonadaceae bacterium]